MSCLEGGLWALHHRMILCFKKSLKFTLLRNDDAGSMDRGAFGLVDE
jgi:hypothetical protein